MKERIKSAANFVNDNKFYIMGMVIGSLAGAVFVKSAEVQYQKEMFAQVENAVEELGLTDQIVTHMRTSPVKKLT